MKEEGSKGAMGGFMVAILAILAFCGKGLKSCEPTIKESVKTTEGVRSSERHLEWIFGGKVLESMYEKEKKNEMWTKKAHEEVRDSALREDIDNKEKKNENGKATERDSVENTLTGVMPLYPVGIRAGKIKMNMTPIIGGWEATINEGDSIRVVNLNIISEHTIYSTGLTGKGKLRETWISTDGNRFTYYDGNEIVNVDVCSISWDTLCAFLHMGDEIAVIPFSRR